MRHSLLEVAARLARGETIASIFETTAPEYAWLNRIVSGGVGERQPNGASYKVFEVL